MNPPQVYTFSQTWTSLPPPSPYHPSFSTTLYSGISCKSVSLNLILQLVIYGTIESIVVVQSLTHVWLFEKSRTAAHQASLSFTISGDCSNSCLLSQWCHPTISPFVTPFSSCPQSFPESRSFPVSWTYTSGGQSIRASASTSVLPMNIQDWFPLGLTGLTSMLSNWIYGMW